MFVDEPRFLIYDHDHTSSFSSLPLFHGQSTSMTNKIDNRIKATRRRLRKACQEKNGNAIISCLRTHGGLAMEKVAVVGDDSKTMIVAYPLSYFLMAGRLRAEPDDDELPALLDDDIPFDLLEEGWEPEDEEDLAGYNSALKEILDLMHPAALAEGDENYLPLILACKDPGTTATVTHLLLQKCPSVAWRGGGTLPVHHYLERSSGPALRVVKLFAIAHPTSIDARCVSLAFANRYCPMAAREYLVSAFAMATTAMAKNNNAIRER